jgi:mRNA interferase RelE/StbE
MSYEVTYDKQPVKFLKKLDKHIAKRILDKADETFGREPVPSDAKTIVGEHGVFRIRIGEYRALYRVNYKEKRIVIFKLEKRPTVY